MSDRTSAVVVRLPPALAVELDRLVEKTGRNKDYYVQRAIIAFLEDQADYRQAVEALECDEGRPSFGLEQVKRELGLED